MKEQEERAKRVVKRCGDLLHKRETVRSNKGSLARETSLNGRVLTSSAAWDKRAMMSQRIKQGTRLG
jgi:hypothetical protein